jgi:hypothetical protein
LSIFFLVAQVQVGLHLMVHGVGPQGDLEAHMKNKTLMAMMTTDY